MCGFMGDGDKYAANRFYSQRPGHGAEGDSRCSQGPAHPTAQGHIPEGTPGVFRKQRGGQLLEAEVGPSRSVSLSGAQSPRTGATASRALLGSAGLSKAAEPGWAPASPAPRPFLLQDGTAAPASGPCPSLLPTGMSPGQHSDIQGPHMEAWGLVARPPQPRTPHWGTAHCTNPAAPPAPWRHPSSSCLSLGPLPASARLPSP